VTGLAFSAASVVRGPGELALMTVEVTKRIFTKPFQFREFVEQAQSGGWDVHVVSSGFHELIEPVLEREGVDVLLHANRVDATPQGWQVDWRYPDDCDHCGESCKRTLLPAGYVVYVGDGYSDRCAALASDRVFATSGLARYLSERGTPFETFSDFRALSAALANRIVTPPS